MPFEIHCGNESSARDLWLLALFSFGGIFYSKWRSCFLLSAFMSLTIGCVEFVGGVVSPNRRRQKGKETSKEGRWRRERKDGVRRAKRRTKPAFQLIIVNKYAWKRRRREDAPLSWWAEVLLSFRCRFLS